MDREIPEIVRAAAGLIATVLDEARKLPETLPGLPVRAIGIAMQQTMKVQQHYAGLVARGDELFTGLRGEDEPGLATFDDDLPPVQPAATPHTGYRESAFDRADDPAQDVTITEDTIGQTTGPTESKAEPTGPNPPRPSKPKASKPKVTKPKASATKPMAGAGAGVEAAQQILDALPADAPTTDEVLEELAIDELVDAAPVPSSAAAPAPVTTSSESTAPATDSTSPVSTALVTTDLVSTSPLSTSPASTSPVSTSDTATTSEPRTAPVTGYDDFSIAQLRGRLRGYAETTVQSLLDYEQAVLAREPYLRMLRNRLERLQASS